MSAAENKEIVRRYFDEVWNQGQDERAREYHSPDTALFDVPQGRTLRGAEGAMEFRRLWQKTSPDLRLEIEEQIAEGDTVVTRLKVTGTLEGGLFGLPPSHRKTTSETIVLQRLRDGKIVESRVYWDAFGLLRDSGALEKLQPMAAAAAASS
jgi:steroid delta-isomerase-like uncharacterized protein